MNDFINKEKEKEIINQVLDFLYCDIPSIPISEYLEDEIKNINKNYKDIGLKDINGKSIYADSSIVEFDYMNDIYKGFFYFNKNELMYFIKILSSSFKYADLDGSFPYTNIKICDFKIIDTIQENKLGLITRIKKGSD